MKLLSLLFSLLEVALILLNSILRRGLRDAHGLCKCLSLAALFEVDGAVDGANALTMITGGWHSLHHWLFARVNAGVE